VILHGTTVVPWYALQGRLQEAVEAVKGWILFGGPRLSASSCNQRLGAAYHANIIANMVAGFEGHPTSASSQGADAAVVGLEEAGHTAAPAVTVISHGKGGGEMWRALPAAFLLVSGTLVLAEPRSWEDPARARAEELAEQASKRFDEVVSGHRLVEIKEANAIAKPIPAFGAVANGEAIAMGVATLPVAGMTSPP
jgi:hypothetical protein